MTQVVIKGTWDECLNPFDNPVIHYFFNKRNCRSDKAGICCLCWRLAQEKNGTFIKTKIGDVSKFIHHRTDTMRPGKDTL